MKAIKIAELKNTLSQILKRVQMGESFVIQDRSEPVAELIPLQAAKRTSKEELVRNGLVRPATRSFSSVRITRTTERVDIQAILQEVREEG